MLLKLEGASSAQALQLPQGTSVTAAAATGVAAAPLHGGGAGLSGAAAICAALPQVHSVLLGQLDLVPSRGGLEAAGLRFLQLQVGPGAGVLACWVTTRHCCMHLLQACLLLCVQQAQLVALTTLGSPVLIFLCLIVCHCPLCRCMLVLGSTSQR